MATIQELIQSAESSNSAQAYEKIGRMYLSGNGVRKDYAQAFTYFRKAADLGSVSAQACTGTMYYEGCGTAKNIKMAKQYLQPAADRGSAEALCCLGWMCYNGDYGFLAAKGKAFTFWLKAAKLGDAESQLNVAISYLNDTWGAEKSYQKAAFWFMCVFQNRRATQKQISTAKEKLTALARYVNLNAVRDEVVNMHPEYLNLK